MCGSMRMPSLGKTVNAETCSRSFMSAAPRANGRYGGRGVVMPNRLAISPTVLMPIFSPSFTAGGGRGGARRRPGGGAVFHFFALLIGGEGWLPLLVVYVVKG